MKVDFSAVILDTKDKPIIERGVEGTPLLGPNGKVLELNLASVSCQSLLATFDDEKGLKGDDKVKRYKLAMQVVNGGEHDLKSEDITELKKLVAKAYGPLIVGRAYDLLDPEPVKAEKKKIA